LDKRASCTTIQIRQAHGIAFVSVFKTGMSMLGGSSAGGCVLAKLRSNTSSSDEADRWSAPSCISCSGLGGALLGGERLDCMLLLNTKSALRKFLENEAEAVVLGANIRYV
jgi:lipid-binding SYLF domain-containing protein